MEIQLKIVVEDKKIAGLLCTAFEGGGVGPWLRVMDECVPANHVGEVPLVLDGEEKNGRSWPLYDYPLLPGFRVVCRLDDGETSQEDDNFEPLVLDRVSIQRGLELMAKDHPKHWADFINENDDATTGDVFVQLCLLGKLVYG